MLWFYMILNLKMLFKISLVINSVNIFNTFINYQFICHKYTMHFLNTWISRKPRTTVSQDVQTRFSVQLAFTKFLFKIKGNFWYSASIMDTALPQRFPFILDRNLAKANCTGNRVCTSCDTVVLDVNPN